MQPTLNNMYTELHLLVSRNLDLPVPLRDSKANEPVPQSSKLPNDNAEPVKSQHTVCRYLEGCLQLAWKCNPLPDDEFEGSVDEIELVPEDLLYGEVGLLSSPLYKVWQSIIVVGDILPLG